MVELITVMSIMVILSTVGLTSYVNVSRNSRDQKRSSDLERIRSALELARSYSNSHAYPLSIGGNISAVASTLTNYIDDIPTDPLTSDGYYYYYRSDGTTYVVCARLENLGTDAPSCPAGTVDCHAGGQPEHKCNSGSVSPI